MAVADHRLRHIRGPGRCGIQLQGVGEEIRDARTVGISRRTAYGSIGQLGSGEILRLPGRELGGSRTR